MWPCSVLYFLVTFVDANCIFFLSEYLFIKNQYGKKHWILSKTDMISFSLYINNSKWHCYYKTLYCSSPLGKNHEADLVKEALHRETQALLSRLNQIKELLSSPEIRMKISKELFEDRHNSSSKWKSCISSGSPNAWL